MDIKEFAKDFLENVKMSVEMNESDYDEELASSILEYVEDNGEVNAPQICSFKKTSSRITAYDYNTESESLDLFLLVKADSLVGKINKNKIETAFNQLSSFYRETMNGTIFKNQEVSETDEIAEVARLIQSSKGNKNKRKSF